MPARETLRFETVAARDGQRLDQLLAGWLPDALGRALSKSTVRRLIMAGAVRVDGRPVRQAGRSLSAGGRIEAVVHLDRLQAALSDMPFEMSEGHVLYEDDALIAVDKPPGLPMHATADPARPHLVGSVQGFLAKRRQQDAGPQGGTPYLGVHQRLDRDTSGVVLFTKDRTANPGLAALFAAHTVSKTYHALTARPSRLPPHTWRAVSRLGPAGRGRSARIASVGSGGVLAETGFTRLESFPGGLLIEARPRSGRKHQIRVHLAEAGLPILGDTVYGGSSGAPRPMLHAACLSFAHPLTGADVVIESPWPEDFERVLRGLRQGPAPRDARPRKRLR